MSQIWKLVGPDGKPYTSAVPGTLGGGIVSLLRRMLVLDPCAREDAATLLNPWQGVFAEAVDLATDLHGRVF